MNGKILSVVVPSYNMEKYLAKCLGSLVIAPTLMKELEVLVVNDGSKDGTSEIAHEFAAKWPGTFKVIDKENGHYGSCVNAALKVLTGKYVRLLDADDYVSSAEFAEYLEFLLKLSRGTGSIPDLVLTDYDKVDDSGALIKHYTQPFEKELVDPREFLMLAASGKYYPAMPGITYRTEILKDLGYVQSEGVPYTDSEWILYPMAGVKVIAYCPVVVYQYLLGRDGQSMSSANIRLGLWKISMVRNENFVRNYSRYSSGESSAEFRAYLDKCAYEFLYWPYLACIVKHAVAICEGGLSGFDSFVKKTDLKLYEWVGTFTRQRVFRFYFVRAWREGKWVRLAMCILCDSFCSRASKLIRGMFRSFSSR